MNLLPGLLLLLPTTAFVLDRVTPDAPVRGEKVQKSGEIVAWHVAADGRVSVRLENREMEPASAMWFISPADKTDSTRLEELMLETVLVLTKSKEPLTIVYEQDKERTGKDFTDAIPIVALMWGTSLAEVTAATKPAK